MQSADVKKFRTQLESLRVRLSRAVEHSREAVIESEQPPGEHEPVPSEAFDCEVALGRNEAEILTAVHAALDRIDRHEFGRCTGCGQPIDAVRLTAIPWTSFCTACEQRSEAK